MLMIMLDNTTAIVVFLLLVVLVFSCSNRSVSTRPPVGIVILDGNTNRLIHDYTLSVREMQDTNHYRMQDIKSLKKSIPDKNGRVFLDDSARWYSIRGRVELLVFLHGENVPYVRYLTDTVVIFPITKFVYHISENPNCDSLISVVLGLESIYMGEYLFPIYSDSSFWSTSFKRKQSVYAPDIIIYKGGLIQVEKKYLYSNSLFIDVDSISYQGDTTLYIQL